MNYDGHREEPRQRDVAIPWRTGKAFYERLVIALRQAQDRLRRTAPRNDSTGSPSYAVIDFDFPSRPSR
jgi:hypothetical protein